MAKHVVKMHLVKETKGALKFQAVEAKGVPIQEHEATPILDVYVRKSAFNGGGTFPQQITLTLEG